jgi:transcription termination/antitermination protein NusG
MSERWFAAYVRSRHESHVAQHLASRSVETFLPQYKSERKWSDRKVELELPLFSGYIFVHINVHFKLQVLEAPGVLYLVGAHGCPEPLEDAEIEQLKMALMNGNDPRPHPFITVGERVVITRGRLEGYQGFVVREKNKHRIVLQMDLINKAMSVEVDADAIAPVRNGLRPSFHHGDTETRRRA